VKRRDVHHPRGLVLAVCTELHLIKRRPKEGCACGGDGKASFSIQNRRAAECQWENPPYFFNVEVEFLRWDSERKLRDYCFSFSYLKKNKKVYSFALAPL